METQIVNLQSPQPVYHHPHHWQTGEAAIEWLIQDNKAACAVTEYFQLYVYGRVDYRNFNEDYHYHGRVLPLPDGLDEAMFTPYVRPMRKAAHQLQQGDVLADTAGHQKIIDSVQPLRPYKFISTRAMQCGQAIEQWQHWQFTRLLRLKNRSTLAR